MDVANHCRKIPERSLIRSFLPSQPLNPGSHYEFVVKKYAEKVQEGAYMMESISLGSTNFGKRTIDLRSAIFVSERAETRYVEKDTGTPEGPASVKRLITRILEPDFACPAKDETRNLVPAVDQSGRGEDGTAVCALGRGSRSLQAHASSG